jgi:hypothetical protein
MVKMRSLEDLGPLYGHNTFVYFLSDEGEPDDADDTEKYREMMPDTV